MEIRGIKLENGKFLNILKDCILDGHEKFTISILISDKWTYNHLLLGMHYLISKEKPSGTLGTIAYSNPVIDFLRKYKAKALRDGIENKNFLADGL